MGLEAAYSQTLDYLFAKLPMFSRIGAAALKPDLSNTLKLCAVLGDPQHRFRSVHIAGTNGKGSTSHGIAAALQSGGYKTGLYTSPHLLDFRERIRINGEPVSKEWVVEFTHDLKDVIEAVKPSFFEITVVMAFKYFADQGVDIAVIETGLGGRLDSTNVVTPLLSVITNISFDHKDLLGNTLAQIAGEKAGIIKPDVPVVIGEQNDETEPVFLQHSISKRSPLHYAQNFWDMIRVRQDPKFTYYKAVDKARMAILDVRTDLTGNYQQHNLKTILTALELLSHNGFNLTQEGNIAAMAHVTELTGLRGRWEWLSKEPAIICDVAHNPAGLYEVLRQWWYVPAGTKHIVVGFVRDKDVDEALRLFPKDSVYYFCNAAIPRALPAKELLHMAKAHGLNGAAYGSVQEAIQAAQGRMGTEDALLITGSFFIVSEAVGMF